MITPTIPLEQHLAEKSQWKNTVDSLGNEVKFLKEQIEWFNRQIFGQKAEKLVDTRNEEQLYFDGFDKLVPVPAEKKTIGAHERTKRKPTGKDKITLPADLPIERQVIDLLEEEKVCRETGETLVKIGEEVTSKLAHKPGSYYIKQIVRPKYANPNLSEKVKRLTIKKDISKLSISFQNMTTEGITAEAQNLHQLLQNPSSLQEVKSFLSFEGIALHEFDDKPVLSAFKYAVAEPKE